MNSFEVGLIIFFSGLSLLFFGSIAAIIWGLLRHLSTELQEHREYSDRERQDFVRTVEWHIKSSEASHRAALAHLSARSAKEATEALALANHEQEALRQAAEAFDQSVQQVQKSQEVPPQSVKDSQNGNILRDIRGNEFEIIGGMT